MSDFDLDSQTDISWAGAILIVAVLALFLSRAVRFSKIRTLVTVLFVSLLTYSILVLIWIFVLPQQCLVTISAPVSGIVISGMELDVSGTVEKTCSRVTLIVRSEKDTRWWVQEIVPAIPEGINSSRWKLTAHFGTINEGTNETFEVRALASNDNAIFNLVTGRSLYPGLTLSTVPSWNSSTPIIVRRSG